MNIRLHLDNLKHLIDTANTLKECKIRKVANNYNKILYIEIYLYVFACVKG